MKLHVLPGDAYLEAFRGTDLQGDLAVFRECLIEGELWGPSLPELWKTRENYLSTSYPESDKSYTRDVADEIEKLLVPGAGDEIYLWFEYELFCSVNYWFCLYLLRDSFATVYRVSPTVRDEETRWRGFGRLNSEDLLECWNDRVRLSAKDIQQGYELWQAFRTKNDARLGLLGSYGSEAFPYMKEVAAAAAEIETRPKDILTDISAHSNAEFHEVFSEFAKRAGVYGFGDVQVKKLLDEIKKAA
jgi:hypothetical protein